MYEPVRGTFPNGRPGNLLAGRLDLPPDATFEAFLAEEAIGWLRRYGAEWSEAGRPFFLATHFFGPHLPYLLPAEYLEMYSPEQVDLPVSVAETFANKPPVQRRYSEHWAYDTLSEDTWRWLIAAYWGYVSHIDVQIGRILETLTELGLADSTCIAFSADHGEFTGAHRLHDKGPAMYDDIYRIPGILRVPGGVPGRRERRFTSLLDFTATILDIAGLAPDPQADGQSLLGLARGQEPAGWRQEITAEFHGHHFPYPQRMIRTETMKLIVNPESINELYDLSVDPAELINRYKQPNYVEVRDRLMRELYLTLVARGDNFHHWMATMYPVGDPSATPSPGEAPETRLTPVQPRP